MGPFELLDVVGLDVSLAIERSLYQEFRESGFAPAPLLEHLVTAGRLGRKTGHGFRDYAGALTTRWTRRAPIIATAAAAARSAAVGVAHPRRERSRRRVARAHVPGSSSAKSYRCPGCDQLIPAGTPHVVAWPAADFGSVEDRRHWHTPCWASRAHRRPGGRRRP